MRDAASGELVEASWDVAMGRIVARSQRLLARPGGWERFGFYTSGQLFLEIFLDYARRMDFRDRDGAPLIGWQDPEGAFEAWKACTAGRPSDYTAMTYDQLRGGSGVQWPCNAEAPGGTERLYADGVFNTDPDFCESYGHDLQTGATHSAQEYRARRSRAAGRSCSPRPTSPRRR